MLPTSLAVGSVMAALAVGHGCGDEEHHAAASATTTGAGGTTAPAPSSATSSEPQAGGAPAPPGWVSPPVRWAKNAPPELDALADDARWSPGPSIGRPKECVIHLARDAEQLMPPVHWQPMGSGVDTTDPRHGLPFASQPVFNLDRLGDRRVAVLNRILTHVDGKDSYHLRVATDLGSGKALGVMLSWYPLNSTYAPCNFGVSRESPRDIDVTFCPLTATGVGTCQRTDGTQLWETKSFAWSSLGDPWRLKHNSVTVGPSPRMRVTAGRSGVILRDLDFTPPPVLLDNQGEPEFWSHHMMGFGNQAVWIESTHDRERLRSYTQAGGVRIEIDRGPGFVTGAAFDGERLSGTTTPEVPINLDDGSNRIGMWTRDPDSGGIRTSPLLRLRANATTSTPRAAGDWAVFTLIAARRLPDPATGDTTRLPILADGSLDSVVVVNLKSWATHRIVLAPERPVVFDGVGTDGAHVYLSLRAPGTEVARTSELRRYALDRIAEWGTPWVDE